jgi:hypothetical protein
LFFGFLSFDSGILFLGGWLEPYPGIHL